MSVPEITSLRTPPDDWEWDQTAHAHRQKLRLSQSVYHVGPSASGRRADDRPCADLPVLRPGVDPLPSPCVHCGGTFLTAEPRLGRHQYGRWLCHACGTLNAWLSEPIRVIRPAVAQPAVPTAPPSRLPRPILHGRFALRVGCNRLCTESYGHDAGAHELYGREQARAEAAARPRGVVRTGALVVDFDSGDIAVNGAAAPLTAREHALVVYLAHHLGAVCPHREIVLAVWSETEAEMWRHPDAHGCRWKSLRVHASRTRQKLGAASELFETITGRGYRLVATDPTP